MTTDSLPRAPRWRTNLRLIVLAVCTTILLLEIIFAAFSIPAGRPVDWSDILALMVVFVLTCAKPRLMLLAVRFQFKQIPLLYKIGLWIAVYIFVMKALYFSGYFAAMMFKK